MRTVLIAALTVVCIGLLVIVRDQGREINNIERQLCAFVFYEDGSAAPRTNDDARLACMASH